MKTRATVLTCGLSAVIAVAPELTEEFHQRSVPISTLHVQSEYY